MFKMAPILQPRPGLAAEMQPLTVWSWTKCRGGGTFKAVNRLSSVTVVLFERLW